jgi:negative regulator of flagellin synthesis FlgM
MTSNIKHIPPAGLQSGGVRGVPGGAPRPRAEVASEAASDRLSLTEAAASIKNVETKLAQTPIVDSGRVERIREAIADGSYEINPHRVADRLLQFEFMLSSVDPGHGPDGNG